MTRRHSYGLRHLLRRAMVRTVALFVIAVCLLSVRDADADVIEMDVVPSTRP